MRAAPRWNSLAGLSLAFVLASPAAAENRIAQRDAYAVVMRVDGTQVGSQQVWEWVVCPAAAERAASQPIEDPNEPAASGSFRLRDSRLDIDVELPESAGGMRFFADGVAIPNDAAELTTAAPDTASARVAVRRLPMHLTLVQTDTSPRVVAKRLAESAGITIAGIENLSDVAIGMNYQCVDPLEVALVLADASNVSALAAGRARLAFSTSARHQAIAEQHRVWQESLESEDTAMQTRALARLLERVATPQSGPAMISTWVWEEAVQRAEQRGDLAESERLVRSQLAQLERVTGHKEGADYGEALHHLGRLRASQGDDDGARTLLDQAIATLERRFGPVHPHLADALSRRGVQFYLDREYDAALPMLRRAIASFGELRGDDPRMASAGLAFESLGFATLAEPVPDVDQARPLLARWLELSTAAYGAEDGQSLRALEMLVQVEFVSDRLREARPLLKRFVELESAGSSRHEGASAQLQAIEVLGDFVDPAHPAGQQDVEALNRRAERHENPRAVEQAQRVFERRAMRALMAERPDAQLAACRLAAEVGSARLSEPAKESRADARDSIVTFCLRKPVDLR